MEWIKILMPTFQEQHGITPNSVHNVTFVDKNNAVIAANSDVVYRSFIHKLDEYKYQSALTDEALRAIWVSMFH